MTGRSIEPDAARLEDLWAGDFGEEYRKRNREVGAGRETFWNWLLTAYPADAVLELGCNNGANLQWIVAHSSQVVGVDINPNALRELRERLPNVRTVVAAARDLPFPDDSFDLAFTAGVLIHQPTSTLPSVIGELVRVSRRYVLALEYQADQEEEVEYRGQQGALFKRNYGSIFRSLFPDLTLLDTGFLDAEAGWDNVTWWLFDKSGAKDR
jgi:pseudaminic acid biosynthesis-associated methylase